jgi:hypothetical protein
MRTADGAPVEGRADLTLGFVAVTVAVVLGLLAYSTPTSPAVSHVAPPASTEPA